MSVEIGSLVVKGSFGAQKPETQDLATLQRELVRMRSEILAQVREIIAETERRRQEP